MYYLIRWIEELYYFPVFFLFPAILYLFRYKKHDFSFFLLVNAFIVLILNSLSRIVYTSHYNLPYSSRYNLSFIWLLLLCSAIGLFALVKCFPLKRFCFFLFVVVLTYIMGSKIWKHARHSWPGYFSEIAPAIDYYSTRRNLKGTNCLLCSKYDSRIALPDETYVYNLNGLSESETLSLFEQAKINHNHLYILLRSRNSNTGREGTNSLPLKNSNLLSDVVNLGRFRDGKNLFTLSYYMSSFFKFPPQISKLYDLNLMRNSFKPIHFPPNQLKRVLNYRMNPDWFSNFYLPAGWNIDETYYWSPSCFPVKSECHIESSATSFWYLKSEQPIVVLASEFFFPAENSLLIQVELEGSSTSMGNEATFQFASVSSKTGYRKSIKIDVSKRLKYSFIVNPPENESSNYRFAFLSSGEIKIYQLVVYEYQPLTDSYPLEE